MCCRCNKKGSPEANAFGLGFLLTECIRRGGIQDLPFARQRACLRRHTCFWLVRKGTVSTPLSFMRKKAPLTVERKNSKGGFASEQTPHPSSCPPLAADRPRPFRCSSFSHTNRFAGFAWKPSPLCNPLKTTKKEAIPLPWNHHPSEYRRWRNSIRQIFNGRKRNNSH